VATVVAVPTGGETLEAERLEALRALAILDTPPEERFDRISRIAAALFGTPTVLVSLMDAERQWHKACVGAFEAETDRALTFCTITIQRPEALVIEDTLLDERFATHPLVTGEPHIRFYAGYPLSTVDGYRVGTICLVDYEPRRFGAADVALLRDLARIAEDELNQRELSQALAGWRTSEQRFRAVFRDAGLGIVLVDSRGRFVEVNAAFSELVGVPAEDLRGLPTATVTHPADRDGDRAAFSRLFAGESDGFHREKRYVRPDGAVIWGGVTASVLRDADGRPQVSIGVIEDITERKELERIKDELLSVVGHELRTPLTSIRGSLGLLEAGVAGELPQEAREMVGIARENTDRLVRLVNDTLDLERLQGGRVDIEPRPVTAGELLTTTARVVQPVADAAGVELDWEADELELMADADRVVQALVNLVANAVKFSPPGACVRTSVQELDGEALVSIQDKGRGIPEDQLETIFERFRQVVATDAREKGGTGLGLAIARAIVEQHAGRIWAESTPGEGATFRFTLPLSRSASAIAVYARRGAQRDELARAVRRHGARVVSFDSPEALVAAQETFVAVVVAGAGGLDELEPGVPVLRLLPGEDVERRLVELIGEVSR
jgi:PAS domain S-box-containing protein